MKIVLSDRIADTPDGSGETYEFTVARISIHPTARVERFDFNNADDELSAVIRAFEWADSNAPLHVWGVRHPATFSAIGDLYREKGYYVPEKNRFEFDRETVSITFGIELAELGYGPWAPPYGTAFAKSARSAFNLGISPIIRMPEGFFSDDESKKNAPFRAFSQLVASWAVSPFRMGSGIGFDLFARGLADESEGIKVRFELLPITT